MSYRIAADPTAPATRRQLRSLRKLMRHHEVTLAALSDAAGRNGTAYSKGYLSEISRGVLPGGRVVTKAEYQRLRSLILELAGK